jgi:hypothetical protein
MNDDFCDDDFDDDRDSLLFMNWYDDLELLARKFDINVSDRDAWREAFDQGMTPLKALAEDYPEVLEKPTKNVHSLKAEDVADAIDIPLSEWPGNCYGIACAILKAGLVEGRAVYGHFLGTSAPGSIFYGKPLVHHGWIETPDGKIVDPTRWVFECAQPYLFVSPTRETKDYDEGGNVYRLKTEKPAPAFNPKEQLFSLSAEAVPMINGMLKRPNADNQVCISEMFWLANLSLYTLSDMAKPLYEELERLDMLSLVPVDNKWKIMGAPAI